jgi:hypothetical protein
MSLHRSHDLLVPRGLIGAAVAWLRGFLSISRQQLQRDAIGRRLDGGSSLARLRDSILGRRKSLLLTRYGAPSAAAVDELILTGGDARGPALLRADVWYYVLSSSERSAMSVRFENGVASEVEFFDAP